MNDIQQLELKGRRILHRPALEHRSATASVVLLHGYGADEHDLMGLAGYFGPNIDVFSIRGDRQTPFGGASWFDIDMLADGSLKFNTEQARESTEGVIELLDEMQERKVLSRHQVILGGFSQGATISNLVTIQNPGFVKGLLIMSGRLPEDISTMVEDTSVFSDLPIFAGHGTLDNVIPIQYGREIVSFWNPLASLEHHEYHMGHEISQAELTHIQAWLTRILITS